MAVNSLSTFTLDWRTWSVNSILFVGYRSLFFPLILLDWLNCIMSECNCPGQRGLVHSEHSNFMELCASQSNSCAFLFISHLQAGSYRRSVPASLLSKSLPLSFGLVLTTDNTDKFQINFLCWFTKVKRMADWPSIIPSQYQCHSLGPIMRPYLQGKSKCLTFELFQR